MSVAFFHLSFFPSPSLSLDSPETYLFLRQHFKNSGPQSCQHQDALSASVVVSLAVHSLVISSWFLVLVSNHVFLILSTGEHFPDMLSSIKPFPGPLHGPSCIFRLININSIDVTGKSDTPSGNFIAIPYGYSFHNFQYLHVQIPQKALGMIYGQWLTFGATRIIFQPQMFPIKQCILQRLRHVTTKEKKWLIGWRIRKGITKVNIIQDF